MDWFKFYIYTYLKPTYLPNYLLLIKQQLNKYFLKKLYDSMIWYKCCAYAFLHNKNSCFLYYLFMIE
jgi:hypothetical protein